MLKASRGLRPRSFRRLAIPLATVGATLLGAAPAPAQTGDRFTCRASVVRIVGQGPLTPLGTIEPLVANRQNDPCRDEQVGVLNNFALPLNLGNVSLLFARTDDPGCSPTTTPTCQPGQGSTAASGVLDVTLNLPAPIGVVRVEVLTSRAQATCPQGGAAPVLTGQSRIVSVDILGQHIEPIPGTHQEFTIPLPAPAGPVVLHLNEQSSTTNAQGGEIRQQALFLDTGILDVVIAESIADYRGNPCRQPPREERFPGWMTGGGFVAEPGSKQDKNGEGTVDPGQVAHHSFSIDCFFPTGDDPGKKDHLNVRWTDDAGGERASFKAESIMDARCFSEGNPEQPRSRFNVIEGRALGFCRSPGGAQIPAFADFRFEDNGEPGINRDRAEIAVSPVPGTQPPPELCGLDSEGRLDGGNHQAHQTRKQFNTPPSTSRSAKRMRGVRLAIR